MPRVMVPSPATLTASTLRAAHGCVGVRAAAGSSGMCMCSRAGKPRAEAGAEREHEPWCKTALPAATRPSLDELREPLTTAFSKTAHPVSTRHDITSEGHNRVRTWAARRAPRLTCRSCFVWNTRSSHPRATARARVARIDGNAPRTHSIEPESQRPRDLLFAPTHKIL